MRIAYFSPLRPKASGVSDYSSELIPELIALGLQIDVFIDNGYEVDPAVRELPCVIYPVSDYERQADSLRYDVNLYHMGNNVQYHDYIYRQSLEHPGVVVFHDYALHHLLAERTIAIADRNAYRREIEAQYGPRLAALIPYTLTGVLPPLWEAYSMEFPANKLLLSTMQGAIVHSQFVASRLRADGYRGPVEVVPMLGRASESSGTGALRARESLGIDAADLVFGSFGFLSAAKRPLAILNAFARIRSSLPPFQVFFVGSQVDAVDYAAEVQKRGLQDVVVFTGPVSSGDFADYLAACDVCLNLRYPTQGETSATLIRALAQGKPIITSDIGSFSEYPGDFVRRLPVNGNEVEALCEALLDMASDRRRLVEMGRSAREYALSKHSGARAGRLYTDFLVAVAKISEQARLWRPHVTRLARSHDPGRLDEEIDRLAKSLARSFP